MRRSCLSMARRGGRGPGRAPTVAVGLAGRLRCASRSTLARRNSLHSLRSLCSNSRRESDVEARAARVPSALLRCSPPHKSPPPGPAHRAATLVAFADACRGGAGKAGGGCASAATYAAPRASVDGRESPRTLARLTSRPGMQAGPWNAGLAPARGRVCVAALAARAPQGTLRAAKGAAFERRRIPATGFASLNAQKTRSSR